MKRFDISKLHDHVEKACPRVVGVSVGRMGDRSTWRATFSAEPSADDLRIVADAIKNFKPEE